jgi:phosphatidylglycerol:prolipoprotein diacylglycerol transferase
MTWHLRERSMLHDFEPEILTTGFGSIYWYGSVYSFGFMGVFLWFWFRRAIIGLSDRDVVTFCIMFAAGILIGGRAFDIVVYELDYYREHPLAALNWWNGGMASHGVLLGGLIAAWLFSRQRRLPLLRLLDEIVVPGAFLLAVGRLGNFIEGGVIGSVTSMPWGFIYENVSGPRHPVALYESAKNFALIPVLAWAMRLWPPGRGVTMGLFVFLYAALRFAVDLFRDYESAWLGIGTGQIFNLAMAALGLLLLIFFLLWPIAVSSTRSAPKQGAGLTRIVILLGLILYPLGIPTSWTKSNIEEKRTEQVAQ